MTSSTPHKPIAHPLPVQVTLALHCKALNKEPGNRSLFRCTTVSQLPFRKILLQQPDLCISCALYTSLLRTTTPFGTQLLFSLALVGLSFIFFLSNYISAVISVLFWTLVLFTISESMDQSGSIAGNKRSWKETVRRKNNGVLVRRFDILHIEDWTAQYDLHIRHRIDWYRSGHQYPFHLMLSIRWNDNKFLFVLEPHKLLDCAEKVRRLRTVHACHKHTTIDWLHEELRWKRLRNMKVVPAKTSVYSNIKIGMAQLSRWSGSIS